MKKSKPAKKMQNVSFKNVDELFEFLPEEELLILKTLRNIILACIPDAEEKLSYNVPYYRRHSTICFLWPASVTWGGKITYSGVRFGFTKGYLLEDDLGYLDKGDRKQVHWRDFQNIKEIDVDILKAYLYDAVRVDEILVKRK